MMKPSDEQISKLPRWAQDHIKTLEMQRAAAIFTLNKALDEQTPSPYFYEQWACTGEDNNGRGPITKRVYVQVPGTMQVAADGVVLAITLRGRGIDLQWGAGSAEKKLAMSDAALIPTSYQAATLLSPAMMRK